MWRIRFVHALGAILVGVCVVAGAAGAASVYKWIDPEGQIHFSDNPPTDRPVEEVKIRTYTGPVEVNAVGDFGLREVKMLTTTWCGVCKRAKAYLNGRGVYFLEYDVEQSDIGRLEYKRLNGKGVPIILVGNQRMTGFSPKKLDEMLKNVGY